MIDCLSRDSLMNFSDEELVLQAAESPLALECLILRYEKAVFRTANALAQNYADAEDYAEEGLLGLLAAVSAFSPEKSVSFRTFAFVCIQNRIRSAIARKGRSQAAFCVSLDDPDAFDESLLADDSASPEQVFLQKERVSELYRCMETKLSKLELEIFSLYLIGYSYAAIADRKGISEKSVENALSRSKRKLRAAWSDSDKFTES